MWLRCENVATLAYTLHYKYYLLKISTNVKYNVKVSSIIGGLHTPGKLKTVEQFQK